MVILYNKESIIGTTQVLKKDIEVFRGKFEKGDKVLVTGKGDRGYAILHEETGLKAIECGFDIFE